LTHLTQKQSATLDTIKAYIVAHDKSPTLQEIADLMGVSKVTIFEHVTELERKGYIRRDKHAYRNIEVIDHDQERLIRETIAMLETIANVCGTSETAREAGRLRDKWMLRLPGSAVSA
jgi:SOS-response transcriptional repressor LexA